MLSHYIPAKTKSILADGNCLFRTFSYLITGSEKSHMEVRGLLCCFMLGAGRLQCWNYVKNKYPQRQISDIEGYLAKSNMSYEYTWGTDCEILTAAYMFGIDIFVAIDDSRRNTKIIWHKYAHSSHPDKPSTGSAIYIQNHHYHFEPVVE